MNRANWATALLGVVLVLIGVWGSWVPHRAAALVLAGWDLAEFAKFLPGISAVPELFYLPVWCAGLASAVLGVQPVAGEFKRLLLVVLALGLMLAILPPYPHIFNGYRLPEFRWRFVLGSSGVLIVIALSAASWMAQSSIIVRGRTPGAVLLLLAFIGAAPAVWQFLTIRSSIAAVYGASLGWGWGLMIFVVGWALVGGAAVSSLLPIRISS
jgi:hypothetical protein